MDAYSKKELLALELRIVNIKHELKALEENFQNDYKMNNKYIMKEAE